MTIIEAPAKEELYQATSSIPLRECVQHAVEKYFIHLDGQPTSDLYNMVLAEVEEPLLNSVMEHVKGNQSKAALLLGLSRGTLRKKLELYGMM